MNVLYTKEKEMCPAYISKINSSCEKQIILSIIPNEEKESWHYLAVAKYRHSFRTENKLKSHEKVCKNTDFCGILMLSKKDNMLQFSQYMKSDKMLYIIYAVS